MSRKNESMNSVASTSGVRDYSCKVCSKVCNSLGQLRAHMSSRSHIRRCERSYSESGNAADCLAYFAPTQVTPEPESTLQPCFLCGVKMTAASLLSHQCSSSFMTEDQLENMDASECSFSHSSLSAQPVDSLPDSYFSGVTSMPVGKGNKSGPFDCLVCNVTLNSEIQYEAHLTGKRHRSRAAGQNTASSDANVSNASFTSRLQCRPSETFCEVCCTNVQVANWAMHKAGKPHNRKLASGAGRLSFQPGPRGSSSSDLTNGNAMNVCSPNIPMCEVCGVPVHPENMATHVAGRVHAWKFLLNGRSSVCTSETADSPQLATNVFRIERSFSSVFNSLPRLTTEKGLNVLSSMAPVEDDGVVLVSPRDLTGFGAQLCLSLVLANRQPGNPLRRSDLPPSNLCYTLWLCPQKQHVAATVGNLRQVLEGVEILASADTNGPFDTKANMTSGPESPTKRPVLLVTLLRDIFTADNPNISVFEHDIIVSTAGSWENFLANVPGADKSLCGLVISGSEAFIKNDPLDRFINKTAMRSDRGRIICLSTSPIPTWSVASCFPSYSLLD